MAASSSSSSTSTATNSDYDVFISHRGPDVKKTFASHLYRRLSSYGLRAFLDQPELQRGDDFTSQIEGAIRSASVHVAIFSTGYAESIWCLNELVLMLESKSPIIPVFYRVEPLELRWTRGKEGGYAKALNKLEKKTTFDPETGEEKPRYDSSTIENWRNALSHVAGISGFELEACNGDEGELVDKVVEGVFKMVKKPALVVAQHPTGLDEKVMDFENTVSLQRQQSRKPRILGLVGLGGVGKTTLAKEFYNRKRSDYSKCCFLYDVRDNADKGSLNLLQTELLKSLSGGDKPIVSVHEGIGILKKHISSPNVLLILDDVDKADQVYELLPDQTVLHPDSLVLITSRNRDVLISSGVEESSIYILTGLKTQHSLELFCMYSFNRPHPPSAFESLVQKFVEACGGLPLSLKVFGALLKGKNTSYWESQLNKLRSILPSEIKQRLQISYDTLDVTEQAMFLDIACFFLGNDRDMVTRIWDNGLCGFQNIQNKCLIEVNSQNKIKMHDHLRDLGRELAKDSKLPRRLWRWQPNDIDDLLQESSVVSVRGIFVSHCEYNNIDDDDVFSRMKRLQLLHAEGVLAERILTKVQFPNLIFLRWKDCPSSSLSFLTSMKNLRVLLVEGNKLETLWEKEFQVPLQLRELEIYGPVSGIPKSIGKLKHLEHILIAHSFEGLQPSLSKFPEEFCLTLLQSLKKLELRKCKALERLPDSLGNLTKLQHISLYGCKALERLPDSLGNLTNLQHISLFRCKSLERLPETLGNLTNLQVIRLCECIALERLPDSFCKLINLGYLDLRGCINITISSETLGNISTLQYIDLTGCEKIEIFPPQVAHQRSLKILLLAGTDLKELPGAIGELSNLEVLEIGSPSLDELPDSLYDLKMKQKIESPSLGTLPPSLCDLKKLRILKLDRCEELKCLPYSLGNLKNLQELHLTSCEKLKCLPASLGLLTQLTKLSVNYCPLISELPFKKEVREFNDLDNCIFPRLQELRVSQTGISEVSFGEGVCPTLRQLEIFLCQNVAEVGTLPNTLFALGVSYCSLRKLDKIYGPAKLQWLCVEGCIELEELPLNETLESLIWLLASKCKNLKSIRGLGQLTNLKELRVSECPELEELDGIQNCILLKQLDVRECPKLRWSAGVVEQLRQIPGLSLEGV